MTPSGSQVLTKKNGKRGVWGAVLPFLGKTWKGRKWGILVYFNIIY